MKLKKIVTVKSSCQSSVEYKLDEPISTSIEKTVRHHVTRNNALESERGMDLVVRLSEKKEIMRVVIEDSEIQLIVAYLSKIPIFSTLDDELL